MYLRVTQIFSRAKARVTQLVPSKVTTTGYAAIDHKQQILPVVLMNKLKLPIA